MLGALNDKDGSAVDWWFMYKLPDGAKPPKGKKGPESTGFEYMYYDSESTGQLALSENQLAMPSPQGALFNTLSQLFADECGAGNPDLGWILYNDEIPGAVSDDGSKGHTKGVLAFNVKQGSAFWLLHSTPRFPIPWYATFPRLIDIKRMQQDDGTYKYIVKELQKKEKGAIRENVYGQTFLCITLQGIEMAEAIARKMMFLQEPQVYGCCVPESLPKDSFLSQLANDMDKVTHGESESSDLTFMSRAGRRFRLIARNKYWAKDKAVDQDPQDFWIDLVGPHLKANLNVETWRRGVIPGFEDQFEANKESKKAGNKKKKLELHPVEDSDKVHNVEDIQYVNLAALGANYEWKYTKDHAKWAVSDKPSWVCVGDINRMDSQEKRGGGTICFQHEGLWNSVSRIDQMKE
jgi:deoxyribonuclease-2